MYSWRLHPVRRRTDDGQVVRQRLQSNNHFTVWGSQPQLQKHVQTQTPLAEVARWRHNSVSQSEQPGTFAFLLFLCCAIFDVNLILKLWHQKQDQVVGEDSMKEIPQASPSQNLHTAAIAESLMRKRKKRTNIDQPIRMALEHYFLQNSKPSVEEISSVAASLNMDKEVVQVNIHYFIITCLSLLNASFLSRFGFVIDVKKKSGSM